MPSHTPEQDWTPEPWKEGRLSNAATRRVFMKDDLYEIQDASGSHIASLYCFNRPHDVERANLDRIVACVNALAGIADPAAALPGVVANLEDILRNSREEDVKWAARKALRRLGKEMK